MACCKRPLGAETPEYWEEKRCKVANAWHRAKQYRHHCDTVTVLCWHSCRTTGREDRDRIKWELEEDIVSVQHTLDYISEIAETMYVGRTGHPLVSFFCEPLPPTSSMTPHCEDYDVMVVLMCEESSFICSAEVACINYLREELNSRAFIKDKNPGGYDGPVSSAVSFLYCCAKFRGADNPLARHFSLELPQSIEVEDLLQEQLHEFPMSIGQSD